MPNRSYMSASITHRATVTEVHSGHSATVRLAGVSDASDCSGCRLSVMCTRTSAYTLPVEVPAALRVAPGTQVEIESPAVLTRRAVALLLILPLALLTGAMALAWLAGASEGMAALAGLAAMTVTFCILYLLRRRISAPAAWRITKILD